MKLKHTLRDLFIFVISITGLSFAYRVYMRRKGPLVRVVCFHDVEDKEWFKSVIELFVSEFHVITPGEFHSQTFDSKKINLLLTFDDAYQSWIDNCVPILRQYNCKAIFFINSGLLDISHDQQRVEEYMRTRLLISPKKTLSWDGAKELVSQGHTIGGHTVSHSNLSLLPAPEAFADIKTDKDRHELLLGVKLSDLAYPFGVREHFNESTTVEAKRAGYKYQYSAISHFYQKQKHDVIPRTLLEKKQPIPVIRRWIWGGYDIFKLLQL